MPDRENRAWDLVAFWKEVFFRAILDAAGYLNEREPNRTVAVWGARSWIHTEDFFEVAELAQIERRQAHLLGATVLARMPVERQAQPRKGGKNMIEDMLNELQGI